MCKLWLLLWSSSWSRRRSKALCDVTCYAEGYGSTEEECLNHAVSHSDETLESKFLARLNHRSLISLTWCVFKLNINSQFLDFIFILIQRNSFQNIFLSQVFFTLITGEKKSISYELLYIFILSSIFRDCWANPHCVYESFILIPCPFTPETENNPPCDKNLQHCQSLY